MVVSEDYCLAPELSVFPDQLADAAEMPLGGVGRGEGVGNHLIYHECINPVLAL